MQGSLNIIIINATTTTTMGAINCSSFFFRLQEVEDGKNNNNEYIFEMTEMYLLLIQPQEVEEKNETKQERKSLH